MSKRIEEQSLEQTDARKITIRRASVRAQGRREAAMPSRAKEASKPATRIKSIDKRRSVKTKAVRKKNVPPVVSLTLSEIIPGTAANHRQEWPQEIEAHTALQARPDLNPTTSRNAGTPWKAILLWLSGAWNWTLKRVGSRQSTKRLRVCESVSLGEKRFVAVIEVDGEQFLVGGASSSVATLARLAPSQEFSEVLKRRWAQDPVQA
jgi:hypothetical protein